jgi:hypothetical protein
VKWNAKGVKLEKHLVCTGEDINVGVEGKVFIGLSNKIMVCSFLYGCVWSP